MDAREVSRELSQLGLALIVHDKHCKLCALGFTLRFWEGEQEVFYFLLQLGHGVSGYRVRQDEGDVSKH